MTTNSKDCHKDIVEILIPIYINQTFSYLNTTNSELKNGQFVTVSFRNKNTTGIVLQNKSEFQSDKLKPIIKIHDLFLNANHINFLKRASNYNMIPIGQLLKMSISSFNIQESSLTQESYNHHQESYQLSDEQEQSFQTLLNHCHKKAVTLLEGVTGSGKTLVYLKLIETLIKQSGQALILLPEIALTTQILSRITKILPNHNILQWHSGITPKNKQKIWHQAIAGQPIIVIGARSALFLPFTDLKIIVVDEEHDSSFKQEEIAIYNARDMSVLKGKCENIPVILSSATPALETIHNVNLNKYSHVELKNRFSKVLMPAIKIVDMRKESITKNKFLSKTMIEAIQNTLLQHKQVLLFLNRKGYAPIALCSKCGAKASCPNCSCNLVYYKKKHCLQCNYCGYITDFLKYCLKCETNGMIFYGPGVERIAEEIGAILPKASIIIATSDTLSNQKRAAALLEKINNHEVDIIIGTQVLAKGLDFKSLQLVGVIDADCHYTTGDLRANERMYQLLNQVSGRAGRREEQGQVLLQAYEPENHILQSIVSYQKAQFIAAELDDRAIANTPPFTRLAIINLESRNETQLLAFAYELSDHQPKKEDLTIFGPSPAPMSLLKGQYRYRFIIKASKNLNLQGILGQWLGAVKTRSSVKVKVDIDPYDFK